MYLLAKFGNHRSSRNGKINSYITSYIDTLEKPQPIISIRHIARLWKSGIPICNCKVLDRAGRKTKRRKTQAIPKCFAFHANAKNVLYICLYITFKINSLTCTLLLLLFEGL